MSYWVASDKVPVNQKSVRIPAENGTNYIANQEIRIRIDPSCKFFNPSATYLEAKVKVTPPTYEATPSGSGTGASPTRLQLDAQTGFQSLIRDIRVHDSNGVLLEEIQNYNTMVAMKYDYHTNDSIKNKRALTEGTTKHDPRASGWNAGTKSDCNNVINNPYLQYENDDNASLDANDFVDCKVCIPLHTGILSSEKIFPNMLMGGITITLLLEDNNRVFRQLDNAMKYRMLTSNPMVRHFNASEPDDVTQNASFNSVLLKEANGQYLNVNQCPFVVGEVLGLTEWDDQAPLVRDIPFQNASGNPEIASMEMDGDYIKLNFNASVTLNAPANLFNAKKYFLWSNSVNKATTYGATYEVTDVNLIVQEVDAGSQYEQSMMRKMKEGGKIMYDFLSVTTYKYSQLSSDRVANIRLPLNNQRCKSILCVPTDATTYTQKEVINASNTYQLLSDDGTISDTDDYLNSDVYLRSNRPNLVGITDHVSDYQWLYDGKLQPSRRVPLSKTSGTKSIDAQHLIELDKALSMADITGHSMAEFNKNFIIGRAPALGDGVYDARNKDFSLQINYNESTAPTKNKLWLSFVYHIRRLEVSGNSVQVIV